MTTSILSVNLNKLALLRNSRRSTLPDLLRAAEVALEAGAVGVTVHPRSDERHIRLDDVVALANFPPVRDGKAELNIEGDLRPELIRLVDEICPTQFTVVPVVPGELTSERGWRAYDDFHLLNSVCERLNGRVRMAVFCDPDPLSYEPVLRSNIDAIEFHTGSYARARDDDRRRIEINRIRLAAEAVRSAALRVHGGHDLDLENLPRLVSSVDFDELSIGHFLTCDALFMGWEAAVRAYRACTSR